jgi:hypothetical protein
VAKLFVVQTQLLESMHHVVDDTGAVEVVGKEPPHQELEREIVNALGIALVVKSGRGDHPLYDQSLDSLGGRQPPIALGGCRGVTCQSKFQAALNKGL